MSATTAVYLITGFLGSGKTTFLNRIIDAFPRNRKLMVLMNEFGDVGIDGNLVQTDEMDMLEISKGSIFCVCVKTDFIKGLMHIAQHTQPDVLIIEATGVANPTDLKKDLQLSIFKNRFQLQEQFCIIDAAHFEDVYDVFTSVEKQIEAASVFIINKIDEADDNAIQKTKDIVRRHHPKPVFFETTHAAIPLEKYLPDSLPLDRPGNHGSDWMDDATLEGFINQLLQDPERTLTPPDRLLSVVYLWHGQKQDQFNEIIALIPPKMIRAKGVFEVDGASYLFNWVMGKGHIEKVVLGKDALENPNHLVFIGTPEVIQELKSIDFKGILLPRS